VVVPGRDVVVPVPPKQEPKKDDKKSSVLPTQGTVVVHLPADANLTVDGTEVTLTSATRKLVTPQLDPGRDYYYTLKATVERDGKTLTVRKRVWVRAGTEAVVDFGDIGAASTAQR
jgi:uncharacterized protein (TIGR03000 family)